MLNTKLLKPLWFFSLTFNSVFRIFNSSKSEFLFLSNGGDILLSVPPLEGLAKAYASCVTMVKFKVSKGFFKNRELL
jgi:hypothetical protein